VLLAFWFGVLCRRRCSTHRAAHAARLRRTEHRGNEQKQNDAREFRNRISKLNFEIEFRNRISKSICFEVLAARASGFNNVPFTSAGKGRGKKSEKNWGAAKSPKKFFFIISHFPYQKMRF